MKLLKIIRPPDFKSKSLSIICVIIFTLTLVLEAYLPSVLKGKINDKNFTISQSLAFSNKPVVLIMLLLFYLLFSYLVYYRGPYNIILFIRLFLILLVVALIITIEWVTTYYNLKDHYAIATTIFLSLFVYIILTSIILYQGLKPKTFFKVFLVLLVPILALLCIIGLALSRTKYINEKVVQLFPSFENSMVVVQFLSILSLGFLQ